MVLRLQCAATTLVLAVVWHWVIPHGSAGAKPQTAAPVRTATVQSRDTPVVEHTVTVLANVTIKMPSRSTCPTGRRPGSVEAIES